ncbi:MAG: ABC transporter ATP-binding protein [Clostridia bacterium]|nr:ABC transporter ATP-binding protein [Clostridia bacterium]MBO7170078.1 ABC transporter ATP-binding protein [Clostridia bacterium]
MTKKIALEMKGVTKAFGSVIANKSVDLTVYKGEILAVLGENGCGKTTLMNMIAGIYYPDAGNIYIDGKEVNIHSPAEAFAHGIGMIHQHFKLVDLFTATENVILGTDADQKYDLTAAVSKVQEIADRYGFHIDPKKKIYDMSVSEKQTVEIIKVLYRGAEILILDEPSAVLTPQETDRLFAVLRRMREDGKSIIIITHKLHEVLSISDRVTILRKGEHIGTVNTAETNAEELTEMMVGQKVALNIDRPLPENVSDRLVVEGLSMTNADGVKVLDNVSFTARSGEILGIAGIAGSGQRELLEAIAGLKELDSGEIIFNRPKKNLPVSFYHKTLKEVMALAAAGKFHDKNGDPVSFAGMTRKQIRAMVRNGEVLFNEDDVMSLRDKTPLQIREVGVRLSFVPEDRLGMGLVGNMDIVDNMMLRSYRKSSSVFVDRKAPGALADKVVKELQVSTPNTHTYVRRLSGGNVQKVLVGREIAAAPSVLMAAYPVRGLDINSSYTIYNLLTEQKKNGVAVVFVGEDLDVLLELCDRIMVVCAGKITGIVDGRTVTKEEVGLLMTKTDVAAEKEVK